MSNSNLKAELYKPLKEAQDARNPNRFFQAVTLETHDCYKCGYYNKPPLKREIDMTESEKWVYETLKKIPGVKLEPEFRTLLPSKSDLGVWCYLCSVCYKSKPDTWS